MGDTIGEVIMVNCSILNLKSLPFENREEVHNNFYKFLRLLEELKSKRCSDSLRTLNNLKGVEIYKGVTFAEFIGTERDADFRRVILNFIANKVMPIIFPIDETIEQELGLQEYRYNGELVEDIGYADLLNAHVISFFSSPVWDKVSLTLEKIILNTTGELEKSTVIVPHVSCINHLQELDLVSNKFKHIIEDLVEDFENKYNDYFVRIQFSPDILKKIHKLDKYVLKDAIIILYSLEIKSKYIKDYNYSTESETVQNTPSLKEQRFFKLPSGKKIYMFNHIKNLPNGNRIYFHEESEDTIYIGYIGKHLSSANH
ncbi:hypothetical protein [Cetobacterium somerae]